MLSITKRRAWTYGELKPAAWNAEEGNQMAPETERLIDLIEVERQRAQKIANDADQEIKESDKAYEEVSKEVDESRSETEEAFETLRRAGLLVA